MEEFTLHPYWWGASSFYFVGAFYGHLISNNRSKWTWIWGGMALFQLATDYFHFIH